MAPSEIVPPFAVTVKLLEVTAPPSGVVYHQLIVISGVILLVSKVTVPPFEMELAPSEVVVMSSEVRLPLLNPRLTGVGMYSYIP